MTRETRTTTERLKRINHNIKKLIELLDIAILGCEVIIYSLPPNEKTITRVIETVERDIHTAKNLIQKVKTRLGIACWDCKHRKSDDWKEDRDFCTYYPTLSERRELFGMKCPYFREVENEYIHEEANKTGSSEN